MHISRIKFTICIIFFLTFLIQAFSNTGDCHPETDSIVIPFSLEGSRIVIYATVNGVEGRFGWDTGAFLSHTFIPLDNLDPVNSDFYADDFPGYYIENGIIINGQPIASRSIITYLPSHKAAGWEPIRQSLLFEGFDGILGLAIFSGWWVEIMFSTNSIILHRNKPQDYYDFTAALAFYSGIYTEGRFLVPANIDGIPINLILDTGLPVGFLFPHSVYEALDLEVYQKIYTIDGAFYEIRTGSISIMGETFIGKTIRTDSFKTRFNSGLIGVEFLQHYDLLLDMRTISEPRITQLYYRQNPDQAGTERSFRGIYETGPDPVFGIGFNETEQGAAVLWVYSPSVAYDEFGIMPGMTIVNVNGQDISGIKREQIYRILVEMAQSGAGELTVINTDGAEQALIRQ